MSTSLPVLSPPKVHTDLLCSCALRLVREWRSISSTACSRWKVAVPAHTRYTAPEPLSTGQWERPNRWAHSPEGIWIWREGTCEKWLHKLSCTEKYLLVGTSTHVSPTLKPNLVYLRLSPFILSQCSPASSHVPHVRCPRLFPSLSLTAGGSRLLRSPRGGGRRTGGYRETLWERATE